MCCVLIVIGAKPPRNSNIGVTALSVYKYGGYSSAVRALDCGSRNEGSIPSSRPIIFIVSP